MIEVVVALALTALMVTAFYHLYATSLTSRKSARDHSIAIELAQSIIDEFGGRSDIALGTFEGQSADGFRWHLVVKEMDEPHYQTQLPRNATLARLEITVQWGPDHSPQSLKLETARIVSRIPDG